MKFYLVNPVIQPDDKTKCFDVYFTKDKEVAHANVPCRIYSTNGKHSLTLLHSHITGRKYLLNSEDVVDKYADLHELNKRGGNVGPNYRDCVSDTSTTRRNAKRANIILRCELMSGSVNLTSPSPPNIQSAASATTGRSANSSLSAADQRALARETVANSKQISEVTKTAKILAKLAIKQGKEHDKQLSAQRNEFTQKLSAQGNEIGRELRDATNKPRRRRSL